MGAKKQTIGFHYLFSILFGIGRGPVDELRAIKVADKIAWEGHNCTSELQVINKPELFGGEKKEGGIQGLFRIHMGAADQVLPGAESSAIGGSGPYPTGTLPDVKAAITSETGGLMGELRGRVTLWFDGLVTSMNPYIKEWKFRIRRARKGWFNDAPWYPEKAIIFLNEGRIFAMNPAHMIYQCSTDPAWARGLPSALIDDNSFTLAANTLCTEGFGLCLVWYRREDISVFIQTIIDHIGAALYTDRETGKIVLKLIRNDYVVDDLPLFTPSSGLLDVEEDDTGSSDTAVNEVIVSGHDPLLDEAIQMRAHNLAAFRAQGAPKTLDQRYRGLPTKDLCARIAQRDLTASAAGLRKFKVVLDRRGFRIHPGAVFKISAPSRGIASIVLRAGEIDDGKIIDGKIIIRAVQDVFGLPATSFVSVVENTWTPPSGVAVAAIWELLFEATYRQIYLARGAADAGAVLGGEGYISTLVSKPSVRSTSYNLLSRPAGDPDWLSTGEHYFTSSAALVADIAPLDTVFVVNDWFDEPASVDVVGQAIRIGEEHMRVDAYNPGTDTFTVVRGAVDTWPQAHLAGDRVWLVDDDSASDGKLYMEGETVEAKVLPRTWSDALEEAGAALLTVDVEGRIARPYPPAAVKVDGDSIYQTIGEYPEPVLTWFERNRLTQADALIGFLEATVAAEAGTTYTARIYDAVDAVAPIGTYAAIASGWTYTGAMQVTDGADLLSVIWVELVAVRDGLESWSPLRFGVATKGGWGYGWGFNWGGAG